MPSVAVAAKKNLATKLPARTQVATKKFGQFLQALQSSPCIKKAKHKRLHKQQLGSTATYEPQSMKIRKVRCYSEIYWHKGKKNNTYNDRYSHN